jgi:hypothetical protein
VGRDLGGRGGGVAGNLTPRRGDARALGAADWLRLAAAPTFAIMALLTAALDGGAMEMRCPAAPAASLLSEMAPMYLLMSGFYAAPWLRLISGRRSRAPGSRSGEVTARRENWTLAAKFRKLIQHRRAKRAR